MTVIKNIVRKILKFEVSEHVRLSKYKNVFAKVQTPNWSEEVFRRHILLVILMVKKCWNIFTKANCKKKVKLDLSNYATKSDLKSQQVSIHQILQERLIYLH